MSKTLAQMAVEFEKQDPSNVGVCCSGAAVEFGQVKDLAGRFADYVRSEGAKEHYATAKLNADPECTVCHGQGVVPTFLPSSPYMQLCGCTFREIHIGAFP